MRNLSGILTMELLRLFEYVGNGGHYRENIIYRFLHDANTWAWMYPDPVYFPPPRRSSRDKLMLVMHIMTTSRYFHEIYTHRLRDEALGAILDSFRDARTPRISAIMRSYRHWKRLLNRGPEPWSSDDSCLETSDEDSTDTRMGVY